MPEGVNAGPEGVRRVDGERVGVLLTQWGEPEGWHPGYRKDVAARTRGEPARSPDEPHTEGYVGTFPNRSSIGLLPFAVAFPVAGLESAHDSIGFFRREGEDYVNVFDPSVRRPAPRDDAVPARDASRRPARSAWGHDAETRTDLFDDVVILPGATGIPDVDEVTYLAGLGDERLLFGDAPPRLSDTVTHVNRRVADLLHSWFGDRVDVACGAYAEADGLMAREDTVALAMAERGVTRMVLARETTDSNTYANDFMTGAYVRRALARAGHTGVVTESVRQVGRTPEYHSALLKVLEPLVERYPSDERVAVVYTTYGLPFPGRDVPGPFSTPHPWAREVYHENALLNAVAFRQAFERRYAGRLRAEFASPPSSSSRVDSYLAYAMSVPDDFGDDPRLAGVRTLRQQLDRAKADGHREILIVLSHWIDDNRDTLLALRLLQQLPLSSRADIAAGRRWVEWSEGGTRIVLAPCFDTAAEEFAVGYAHRVRGGVERFGLLAAGCTVAARGRVTRAGGGEVAVTDGPLTGARLVVPAPPDPEAPWTFTSQHWRFVDDPADAMLTAWDDLDVTLGTDEACAPPPGTLGPVVVAGPTREIVNRPATLVLPLAAPATTVPGIRLLNAVTNAWEEPLVPPGGRPARLVEDGRAVAVDVGVLGAYAAVRTATAPA